MNELDLAKLQHKVETMVNASINLGMTDGIIPCKGNIAHFHIDYDTHIVNVQLTDSVDAQIDLFATLAKPEMAYLMN